MICLLNSYFFFIIIVLKGFGFSKFPPTESHPATQQPQKLINPQNK